MKRKFSFPRNKTLAYCWKWIASFGVSFGITLLMMLIITPIHKRIRFSPATLETLALILVIVMSFFTSYFFVRFSKCKGMIGGAVSALILIPLKAIPGVCIGGQTGKVWEIMIAVPAACLIGGVLSANRKPKGKRKIGNLHKFMKS